MQKFIESTGKTQEAAVEAALEKLGLSRDQISVEVLELAKPGFLGIGGTPAKVKVTYEVPDEPVPAPVDEPAPAPKSEVKPEPKPQPKPAPKAEKPVPKAEKPAPKAEKKAEATAECDDEKAGKIDAFLTGLFEKMGVEAEPRITVDAEGTYLVELVGSDLGPVIGRRGETLDAIQQLAGYAVNRGENHRTRIRIDAEGYRSKREESLERMANRVADKVIRYRRNMTLEPMNAYERHVIHTALQDRADITTYSVGTEPNRRTVVAYAPGEHRK